MGTNYYATFIVPRRDFEGTLYKTKETLHIGKSSGGWVFSFHGYKDKNDIAFLIYGDVETVQDWINILPAAETITDEYGVEHTVQEFMEYALSCNQGRVHAREYPTGSWVDVYQGHTYSFSSGDWS